MTTGDAPRSLVSLGATLGEGPVWDAAREVLWFVDIKGPHLYRYDPADGAPTGWDAPRAIGWALPAHDGTLLCGMRGGIARFRCDEGVFEDVLAVEAEVPGNRLNDATVAPDGHLWFGSMDDGEHAASGRLYRLCAAGVRDSGLAPVAITNGPAFSPDGRTLYHTDTLGRAIHAVDVDAEGGLGSPRIFARIEAGDGHPDGSTVDSEGCVWVGMYGGWAARRYAPDGELMEVVRFPVANVTKLAFGGDDLRTVYATTARQGLDAAALARQPQAGDLFSFRVAVPGLPIRPIAVMPRASGRPVPFEGTTA